MEKHINKNPNDDAMPFPKSLGAELLKIARQTVRAAFSNENFRLRKEAIKRLSVSPGVFVNIYVNDELRGSFGYPPGTYPLSNAIKRAARGAAFMDPRFGALAKREFAAAKFEVVLAGKPKLLKVKSPAEYAKKISPKKHGLYIEYGPFKAMQLPMFAAKRKFSARDYLEKTIEKSGLAPEMWQSRNLRVYTFAVQRFAE